MKFLLSLLKYFRKQPMTLGDVSADIDKDLHIHEPATYQLKRKPMKKRKPC